MKLQMWQKFVTITYLDGEIKWMCTFFIQYWMDPWMDEKLVALESVIVILATMAQ
jgi:hypothetical protein